VLLLDEPYSGLDPNAAQVLTDLLADLAGEGCTVVLTTHNLERGLIAGRRVVVLVRGRIVYDERGEAIDPATFPDTYRALTA
jgi:ABC-type multidrug transport system ATPase subunit